jgi:hypothetical protein
MTNLLQRQYAWVWIKNPVQARNLPLTVPSRATTFAHLMKHWSTGYSERLVVKVKIHSVVVAYTVYLSQRPLSNRHSGPSAPQAQHLGRRETMGDCWTVFHAHHFLRIYLPHL